MRTALGEIVDEAPLIYQEIDGRRVEMAGQFVLLDEDTYAFDVTGGYDPSCELVIDPVVGWSTWLGGSISDEVSGIAADGAGSVYLTGATQSPGWLSGGYDTTYDGETDAFVIKLGPAGDHVWSTYLGGDQLDRGNDIAVHDSEGVYVTGQTNSSDWVSGGYAETGRPAFVAKLSTATGNHLWSSYLRSGRSHGDLFTTGIAIAVDDIGNAYVTGERTSSYMGSAVVKVTAEGGHAWTRHFSGERTWSWTKPLTR